MSGADRIDLLLRNAAESGRVPGVAAAAATPAGVFCEGAAASEHSAVPRA